MFPKDPDAQRKLRECEKHLRKIRFEKAIASDDTEQSIADTYYSTIGVAC